MPILNIEIDSEDILNCDWREAIDNAKHPTIDYIAASCSELVRKTEESGGSNPGLALIAAVGHIALRPGTENGPFVPMWSDHEKRSALPEDLEDHELDALIQLADICDEPEIEARVNDIAWLLRRDHKRARAAISSYLESAKHLDEIGEHLYGPRNLERAVELAALISGRKEGLIARVLDVALDLVRSRHTNQVTTRTEVLLDLLVDRRHGDLAELARIAGDLAGHLEEKGDYYAAAFYWRRSARAYEIGGYPEERRSAQIREAECYVLLPRRNQTRG